MRDYMKETDKYIETVNNLKEKYKSKIQIYLGIEEDSYCPVKNREVFDYIIGSAHCVFKDGEYFAVDHSIEVFNNMLKAFDGNIAELTENYYSNFCTYIKNRKPDIIGHFDLLTKFDEKNDVSLIQDKNYNIIVKKYLNEALKYDCFFEVNTGAISRNYRTSPYPNDDLLYIIKKENGRVIITSDAHSSETIDCHFKETRKLLKDIGFQHTYLLYNNEFIKDEL